jgi:hypothetical protein
MRQVRLLPWLNAEGKPCLLLGDVDGPVSRIADQVESVQLGMAGDLLDYAADLLEDRSSTPPQIRFLARRLTESLQDVLRVAESRGARLAHPHGPAVPLSHPDDGGPRGAAPPGPGSAG